MEIDHLKIVLSQKVYKAVDIRCAGVIVVGEQFDRFGVGAYKVVTVEV